MFTIKIRLVDGKRRQRTNISRENGIEFVESFLGEIKSFSAISDSGEEIVDANIFVLSTVETEVNEQTGTPEMVVIPAGTFEMGSRDGYDDEKPVHSVEISTFAIGKYKVTFDEYDKFCEATGIEKPNDEGWGRGKRPVINVNWHDAKYYCYWLSKQTGKEYRLPSESEWEYACRAGSTGKYCFGDDVNQLKDYAWYSDNSGNQTHPVGEKKPNKFGLYDMHGNVWEWCEDSWHENYNNARTPKDNRAWINTNESRAVLRGGSWWRSVPKTKSECRCSLRIFAFKEESRIFRDFPEVQQINIGFRLAMEVKNV